MKYKVPESEAELREWKCPWPETELELCELLSALVDREHEYGTCVYAMSIGAQAMFNYIAGKLGCMGFQVSFAELDFLRRTRGLTGPFIVLDGSKSLYPQYDLRDQFEKWIGTPEFREYQREASKKLLKEGSGEQVSESVWSHWKKLAEGV